jgi:hypothetical protein
VYWPSNYHFSLRALQHGMRVMYTSLWAQYYILLKLNDYIALFKPKNKKIFFTVPSISVRFPAVIINRVDCSDGKILTLAVSDQ